MLGRALRHGGPRWARTRSAVALGDACAQRPGRGTRAGRAEQTGRPALGALHPHRPGDSAPPTCTADWDTEAVSAWPSAMRTRTCARPRVHLRSRLQSHATSHDQLLPRGPPTARRVCVCGALLGGARPGPLAPQAARPRSGAEPTRKGRCRSGCVGEARPPFPPTAGRPRSGTSPGRRECRRRPRDPAGRPATQMDADAIRPRRAAAPAGAGLGPQNRPPHTRLRCRSPVRVVTRAPDRR